MESDIKFKLKQLGLNFVLNASNNTDLLKLLLKVLHGENINIKVKLEVLLIIEEGIGFFFPSSDLINLTISSLKTLVDNSLEGDDVNNIKVIYGQALMTSTTILITTYEQRVREDKLEILLATHLEHLLHLITQANNKKNVYLRSIAANCLVEVELFLPGVLRECLDVLYTLCAFETTIAHQQYLELLSLLINNTQNSNNLQNIIFHIPASILSRMGLSSISNKITMSEIEQMITFIISQLNYVTTSSSVRITSKLITTIKKFNPEASLSSAHLLQNILNQYLFTQNLTAFQLILNLEKYFGSSAHYKDDSFRQNILDNLINCSSIPILPISSRLICLNWLTNFVSSHPDCINKLSDSLVPFRSDGSHTKLRKFDILLLINNSTDSQVINCLNDLHNEMTSKKSIKLKAAFTRILYNIYKNNENEAVDYFKSYLYSAVDNDIEYLPFLSNLLRNINNEEYEASILTTVLTNVLQKYPIVKTFNELKLIIDYFIYCASTSNVMFIPRDVILYVSRNISLDGFDINAEISHQILSLCHKIMKLYDVADFSQDMNEMLKILLDKCNDEDVQDRIKSYFTILKCLADQSVTDIIKSQKKSTTGHVILTDGMFFRPGIVNLSDIPYFKINKIDKKYTTLPKFNSEDAVDYAEDLLEQYFFTIQCDSNKYNEINIPIEVESLTEDKEVPMLGVAIIFQVNPNFGKLEPLLLGHVAEKMKQNDLNSVLKYFPSEPFPVNVDGRSEFTLNDTFYSCKIDEFQVNLKDIIQPLPVLDEFMNSPKHFRKGLFDQLWNYMENTIKGKTFTSSMIIRKPINLIRQKIKHDMKPFVTEKDAHETKLGFYIAPNAHVLLKIHLNEEFSKFKFICDNIYLLAHVNDFLHECW